MVLYDFLFDIIKYTVAGTGVVWIAFYLFKPYLDKSESIQLLEIKKDISKQTLPIRLQAYERIVLFVERVNPSNMLIRLNGTAFSAAELHALVVAELRSEFQHNITQQLYVSTRAWAVIKRVKDDTLSVVNNAAKALPENATGLDLSKIILAHLSTLETNPYDIALSLIRNDVEELF
jgi:Na+/pantothenate symporter